MSDRLPQPAVAGRRASGQRVRTRHVAEIVADDLRWRILEDDLVDGLLPKQDDLAEEFGVSLPSIREALRILETEGLITVRRGKLGGAVVHPPAATNAAYTLGLVLRARSVSIDDVATALRRIEPVCVGMCAARPDRHEAVLPALEEVHAACAATIEDRHAFILESRRFHETLVAACGDETLILVIGALESLVSAHAEVWGDYHDAHGFPDRAFRQHGLDDHTLLLRLIDRGEPEAAARHARRHLEWTPVYSIGSDNDVRPGLLASESRDRR